MLWYFNKDTGNFSVGSIPTKEVNNEIVEEQGWELIPTRPEPYDNYLFDGENWYEKPLDVEALKHNFINAIQNLMDAKAKEKGYDNIVSACSYAGYDNPFRAEGEAYGLWRANCWKYGYEQLALILGGGRDIPTVEAFIQELPLLEL